MLNYFFTYPLVWLFVLILYIMNFSSFNIELNIFLIFFIIISSIISLVFGIKFRKNFKFKKEVNKKISLIPIILILILSVIEFICMKQIPFLSIAIFKTHEYSHLQFVPILHVIVYSICMYYCLYYFYNYICNKKGKIKCLLCYFIILFIFLLYYTRSFILIIMLASINMLLSYLVSENKIKIKHLIISIFTIIFMLYGFGVLGNLRHGYKWNDNSYIENIGLYNNYPKYLPKQFMWSYSYLTTPLANLNYNIQNKTNNNVTKTILIIKELIPETFSKRLIKEESKSCKLIKSYFNVSTGFCPSYINGSFLGTSIMFMFMMILGFIGCKFYYNKNTSSDYVVFCSFTCILYIFMFFDNMLSYVGVSIPFWISFCVMILKCVLNKNKCDNKIILNNEKKRKFAIIIPVYNCEKYIINSVESILKQTYNNYEIIIVDDGSTDNSLNILKENFSNNKKVKIYTKINGGVSSARNFGLSKVSGDWVTFLDSDDWFEKNTLEEINDIINLNNDVDLIFSNIFYNKGNKQNIIYELNELIIKNNDKYNLIETIIDIDYGEKKYGKKFGNCRCIGGKFYKTDLIKNNNLIFPTNITSFEDGIFNLYATFNSKCLYITNKTFYHYYFNENSRTNTVNNNQARENRLIIENIKKFLKKSKIDSDSISYCSLNLFTIILNNIVIENSKEGFKKLVNEFNKFKKYIFQKNIKYKYLTKKNKLLYILLNKNKLKLIYKLYVLKYKIR